MGKLLLKDRLAILQLIPDKGLRNYSVESLAKTIAELYAPPKNRIDVKKFKIRVKDVFSYRITLQKDSIAFYLIVPERLLEYFKQKILAVWDKATVRQVDCLPELNPKLCACSELTYRRHDIFSLMTDKDINAPLPSILAASSEMNEGDYAVIDILMDPANRVQWEFDSRGAYEKFQRGKMPRRLQINLETILKGGFGIINNTFSDIQKELLAMGKDADAKNYIPFLDPERQAMAVRGLSPATTSKLHSATLKTWIRIASQSDNRERGGLTMRALAGAFKDITADNELIRKDKGQSVAVSINKLTRPLTGGVYLSTAEAGKLMQLPTAQLQLDYPIEAIKQREVGVNEELFADPNGVPIGSVTERGVTKRATIPMNVFNTEILLKHIYDALCTPTIALGQMGCGKTEGMGITWSLAFIKNGFSSFIIDTADGELLRKLEDALPADYPPEKIIHIELDNKHFPIALNWADSASRQMVSAEGDDLEALEMAERMTNRLIDYIDGSASAELSERMRQYLTSACRATLINPNKSILDVELALRSPTYREELLADPLVKQQIDVMQDLESLQARAAAGSDASVIDPIISRLKMFFETQSLARIFMQPSKLNSQGRPLMDFRHYADNPEGGYGYLVCIHASQDAWSEDGQELLLSFIQDKILMAIYSRIDITQDERKPCLNIIDEPHKFIKKAARLYKNASVELRKYRLKLLWLAHYMSQMGNAAEALASGGVQFTQYKTQNLKQFDEIGHVFAPFDSKELYDSLPEKWEAVNRVRLASGKDSPAFIAKMEAPPKPVKSREERRKQCAEELGRPWREVQDYIQQKRLEYQRKDEAWRDNFKENKKKSQQ